MLNFGGAAHSLDLSHLAGSATIALASDMRQQGAVSLASLVVGPHEGLVLRLASPQDR